MYIALFIASREEEIHDPLRVVVPIFLVGTIGLILVMLGGDLGTATIIALILFVTLSVAGAPLTTLSQIFIVGAAAAALFTTSSASRMARITAWLNPGTASSEAFNWQYEHGIWEIPR
jgi:cell division protein FtsW